MRFGSNEEIFGEGEPAEYVYRVSKGAVRSYKILCDGRRQIGGFYLPGDIFGLEIGEPRWNRCPCEVSGSRAFIRIANADPHG